MRLKNQHSVHEVDGLITHFLSKLLILGPLDVPLIDVSVHSHRICPLEWNRTDEHFEQNGTHCPDINGTALLSRVDDFW